MYSAIEFAGDQDFRMFLEDEYRSQKKDNSQTDIQDKVREIQLKLYSMKESSSANLQNYQVRSTSSLHKNLEV